jgi:glycosyltransferase involved in cell wall biosynthesis
MNGAAAPSITVAVPVYNGVATLEECLRSIADELVALSPAARAEFEVIVCDNHSTDGSPAIIAAYAAEHGFRVTSPPRHFENRTENWRFALNAATGTWMMMLHADDALVPGGLAQLRSAVGTGGAARASFVTARHQRFEFTLADRGRPRPTFPRPSLLPGRQLAGWALPLLCPFVPFSLMRRAAYEAVGGLDNSLQLTQDWDLWFHLCGQGDVLYWPATVGAWRQHETSASYQRLNMREHLSLLARFDGQRDVEIPTLVRWLARRSMSARVRSVLGADESTEARAIVRSVPQRAESSPHMTTVWLRVGAFAASLALFTLRSIGTVRQQRGKASSP